MHYDLAPCSIWSTLGNKLENSPSRGENRNLTKATVCTNSGLGLLRLRRLYLQVRSAGMQTIIYSFILEHAECISAVSLRRDEDATSGSFRLQGVAFTLASHVVSLSVDYYKKMTMESWPCHLVFPSKTSVQVVIWTRVTIPCRRINRLLVPPSTYLYM